MTTPQPKFAFASPADALTALCAHIKPIGTEQIDLAHVHGRILAAPLAADRPSPACDVSAMDGYAVRLTDLQSTTTLPVESEILIGREPPAMPTGACQRIVTGAPVPAGADAVLRREDTTEHPDHIEFSREFAGSVKRGDNIRWQGENLQTDQSICTPGTRITPALVGALATFGVPRPTVHKRVRVAIIITGDEVLAPAAAPNPYQLRDSNGPALFAALAAHPWLDVCQPVRTPDDYEPTRAAIAAALPRCDALLLTGGVSMGTRDHVPAALADCAVEQIFHKLPQRPGKPAWAGVTAQGQPVLGLPGNPVSVLVTARRLALPALGARAGMTHTAHPPAVTLTNADDKSLNLYWHRSVRLTAPGRAELIITRGSGDIPASAHADGFVEIPPGKTGPGPWPFYAWSQ